MTYYCKNVALISFSTVWKKSFQAVFVISFIWILLAGCARQKVLTPPAEIKKVPAIRVALSENLNRGRLLFLDPYRLSSEEADYILDRSVGEFTVTTAGDGLILNSPLRQFSFTGFEKIEFIPVSGGQFQWNGIPFSGVLTFIKTSSGISVINRLPLPDYLAGVVPYEIPSHSEEYYQAVVSQTIAARTYAINALMHSASPYFDLYADTRDQLYQGSKISAPLVLRAIRESRGVVLQNPEKQIEKIQYHSTCGGIFDSGTRVSPSGNAPPQILADLSGQSNNCLSSPLYRWMFKMNSRQILENLENMGLLSSREVQQQKENGYRLNLEVLSRQASGRVAQLKIDIADRHFTLNEWQTRRVLAEDAGKTLPSTLFIFKASQNDAADFYIIGGGYGHGRGMCQWGAIGQALEGKTYGEILKFYYPDFTLTKVY